MNRRTALGAIAGLLVTAFVPRAASGPVSMRTTLRLREAQERRHARVLLSMYEQQITFRQQHPELGPFDGFIASWEQVRGPGGETVTYDVVEDRKDA